ncbi:hypothetical protein AAFX15_07955 [Vibrio chagasii]|uniref:hypothetical protein n=1 Tax=Vibrio chagasii TaxID=170679 RepID=UPI0038CE717C
MSAINKIEGSIVNDRYLESIAIALYNEAKAEKDGYRFKKLVPAMTFYCFAIESKLNTFGKEVFTKKSEFRKFGNATIQGKFDWLLSRLGVDAEELVEPHRETVANMVLFRNSVAHSKSIDFEEERKLIGLEQFGDKFLHPPKHEKDFMSQRSLERCESYKKALEFLDTVWFVQSPKFFGSVNFSRGSGFSSAKVVDRN